MSSAASPACFPPVRSAAGFPRSWSSAERRTASGASEVCRRLHDREEVLVERERLARGAEVVADHRPVLRQHLDEGAGVPREPQGEGGPAAEEELRELPEPVRLLPAADPLRRDVPQAAGARAHLVEGLVGEREVELRDEAQAAEDAQGILLEAPGRDRAQEPLLEIDAAAERVDELVRLEPLRHRVDGEVAAPHVVLDRDGGIRHDLEVAVPRPDAALAPRRRQLDARGRRRPHRGIARVKPHPDELAVDLHVVHAPVGLERRAETRLVEPRDEEVLVRVRDPEQLVAHRPADDVGVEAERADVAADLGGHSGGCGAAQRCAIASISTSAPAGSFATSNVERAGGVAPTWLA